MYTSGYLLVDGTYYAVRLTKQRQFFNGVEVLSLIDVEGRTVLMSSIVRQAFVDAAALLRKVTPARPATAPTCHDVWISGCFLWRRRPWPWEVSRPLTPAA